MLPSLERPQEADKTPPAPEPGAGAHPFLDRLSRRLDTLTGGHAAQVMRLASFLVVGGFATVVNLGCVWLFSRYTHWPYALYVILATEISLLVNYTLNDRFTFRALVDGQRSWWLRCVRFHVPAMLGFGLTLAISDSAHYLGHLSPVLSQGIAILIVTCVNFVAHHLWTYRATPPANRPADLPLL